MDEKEYVPVKPGEEYTFQITMTGDERDGAKGLVTSVKAGTMTCHDGPIAGLAFVMTMSQALQDYINALFGGDVSESFIQICKAVVDDPTLRGDVQEEPLPGPFADWQKNFGKTDTPGGE